MSLSPATVAAVLSIDYLALGRHVDEATAAGWALSLEDLADGPDVVEVARRLAREGFFTAPELRQAVTAERARAERSAQWERPDLSRPALEDRESTPQEVRAWLAKCAALKATGPLARSLKTAIPAGAPRPWQKPDENYFAPPQQPAPEQPPEPDEKGTPP